LVELLVVIAIIGVLAALLMPALSAAKFHARSISCKNHLHQMGVALQLYVHENQNRYPFFLGPRGPSYGDAVGQGENAAGLVYWSSKLFPYYPLSWTNNAFHCPGYMRKISGPFARHLACRQGSYAYNTFGVEYDNSNEKCFGLGPIMFWKNAQGAHLPAVAETQIMVPSAMLAIGDSFVKVIMDAGEDNWGCCNNNDSSLLESAYALGHGKNYNQLCCDGHISAMSPSILFDPSKSAPLWNYDNQPHPELWTP